MTTGLVHSLRERDDALSERAADEIERLTKEMNLARKQRDTLAFNAGKDRGRLDKELTQTREDAALVVHALNCALQLVEALIAYTQEGTTLHPSVATAKGALDQAMNAITRKRP